MELTKSRTKGTWGRQADFILSCIGYAVGVGNVWRFPYLTMKNGGGAFLIPYLLFMAVAGIPLFFLELSLGQFTSLSAMSVWDMAPLFRGLGLAMCLLSGMCTFYLNTVITWSIYYLYHSFTTGPLPWSTCSNPWNTPQCVVRGGGAVNETSLDNVTDVDYMTSYEATSNVTSNKTMTPAEEFWRYEALRLSSGIHEIGSLRVELALCHVVGWIIVTLCLIRGIKSSGKVVYVTATLPYVFLTILLVQGCMMPGAVNGIIYYLKPDFSRLAHFQIWVEACIQIFFSLGPSWGALITMASFNKFDNNCLRDACVVPLVNCGTSVFGGFVIFSIIGGMAHQAGLPVDEVITPGVGLAFIAYPEALSQLSFAPVWSVCFFLMLITIGLDTQFGLFETLAAGVCDHFDIKKRRFLVTMGLASVCCVSGFIFCTQGGMYVFQIVDWYSSALGLLLIGIMESLIISWCYGINEFFLDIQMMLGRKPPTIFKILWPFFVPLVLTTALIYSLVMFTSPSYGSYEYPEWSRGLGWALSSVPLFPIIIFMIMTVLQSSGTLAERWRYMCRPNDKWGPAAAERRLEYQLRREGLLGIEKIPRSEDDLTRAEEAV